MSEATTYEAIRYEQADGVATVTLNRPDVHNAMNQAMRRELLEVFTRLRSDDSVRVVIVTGAGEKAFSAGADIREFLEPPVQSLAGRRVVGTRRIGKRIVLELEEELFAVIHLMIAGRLRWRAPGKKVAGASPLVRFEFPRGSLLLTEAGVNLALSDDPAIASAQSWRSRLVLPYLDVAVQPDDDVDREVVAEVLQAVLFQALLGLARRRYGPDEAKALLSRAAHLMLDR